MCKPGSPPSIRIGAPAAMRMREAAPLAFAGRWARRIARLALPQACILCGASCVNMSQRPMCPGCDADNWNEARLRCRVCAIPLSFVGARGRSGERYVCEPCKKTPPAFERTFVLADYRAPLEQLAVGLKFGGRLLVAREFAHGLGRVATDELTLEHWPDVVTPVPLAHERLVERGFNQAWEIARPLARALAVPADPALLRRVANTSPQSRLDLDARRRNVGAAFRVERPVHGLHLALVDDVMTSGATLEAAARALKAEGARHVTNFVALRTAKD